MLPDHLHYLDLHWFVDHFTLARRPRVTNLLRLNYSIHVITIRI